MWYDMMIDVASPDVASPDVASPDVASPDEASPEVRLLALEPAHSQCPTEFNRKGHNEVRPQ